MYLFCLLHKTQRTQVDVKVDSKNMVVNEEWVKEWILCRINIFNIYVFFVSSAEATSNWSSFLQLEEVILYKDHILYLWFQN